VAQQNKKKVNTKYTFILLAITLKPRFLILFLLLPLALLPIMGVAAALTVTTVQAQTTTSGQYDTIGIAVSAGLAVGLSSLAAGLAISSVGTAAVSALAEKPETFFRAFLVVALAEALAIYGLIMGILLWLKL
jgi:F0F1-type ATP synthase membrane subunit c/vacuolar-type H+-ATPase subunit K